MAYGVLATGFAQKRLATIIEELQASYRSEFGAGAQVGPESLNGQKIAIIGERIADLWELAQAVYDAGYLMSSRGASLDRIGLLVGLSRLTDETDATYRLRLGTSFRAPGRAAEALRAGLIRTTDVTEAVIIENTSSQTDEKGRPPHSFEAVVRGGTDINVATAIWVNHPDGIQPVSTAAFGPDRVTVAVNDSLGASHSISFSRPTDVPIAVQYTYRLLPGADETEIKRQLTARLIQRATEYKIGKDVYPYDFEFSDVPGVANLDAAVKRVGGSFTEGVLPIYATESATFSTDDITWVKVP